MNVLLSIKPKYADLIYKGEKTIEFRKSMPRNFDFENDVVFIYETNPVCMVTGWLKLIDIREINNRYLKSMKKYNLFYFRYFQDKGKLNFDDLLKYVGDKKLFTWLISDFYKMSCEKVRCFSKSEKPPQSWCYTKAFICNGTLNYDHVLKFESRTI